MADQPPDPKQWKPATAWGWANPPRHHVKATTCGKARRHHGVTTNWDEVNCPDCLEAAPFRRVRRG